MDAALSWAGLGGLAGGLVAQTAHMDRAADRAEGSDADALGPLGAKGRGPQARWAGASTALAPASLAGGQAGQGASSVASSTVAGGGAAQEGLVPAGSASTAPVAPDMQGAAREGGVVNPLPSATHEASAPLQQALQAALQEQRGAAGTPAQPVARTTPEGAVGMAPTPERAPGAADAAAPAPDASALAGEDAMAEQVAFWVNQNSQSAEMTLDRDGQPMQVRVALSGNEAHVAFRSDQVQTREALDAGMAQLRELLQAQGLVLAGVTVGDGAGAGAGGAMPQSGQPGGEGRGAGRAGRAQVAPAPAVGSARAPVPGTRGLDVFV
jgi:flagellar hook-length control protein FliK